MPRLLWRMCFAMVLFLPATAQETVKFDGFCDYFSPTPPPGLRLDNPEPRVRDLLASTLSHVGATPPKLFAANVRSFAAAWRGSETFLLYNPRYFDAQVQSGRFSPEATAILVHQLVHLSYSSGLTTEPSLRQRMELLADETSGKAMRNLSASAATAVSPLAEFSPAQQSALFPTIEQRRAAILSGWATKDQPSASMGNHQQQQESASQKGGATGGGGPGRSPSSPSSAARPPTRYGNPAKSRPPKQESSSADRYNPPPPSQAAGGGAPASAEPDQPAELPRFPWPPPEASAFARIPSNLLFARAPATPRLRDAAASLIGALTHAGYSETSFYSVPGGFALASRMEQIYADGRPLPGDSRWALNVPPESVFCLSCYVKALFTAGNPGHFRVVVFIVSSTPFAQAQTPVTAKDARIWVDSGAIALPAKIGAQPFTSDHLCTALIYEFELRQGDSAAALKLPGTLTGAIHLARAGIWPQLN